MPPIPSFVDYFEWIDENVNAKGLVAANPMTAERLADAFPNLGGTVDERMFYARQIVNKYNAQRGHKHAVSEATACRKEGDLEEVLVAFYDKTGAETIHENEAVTASIFTGPEVTPASVYRYVETHLAGTWGIPKPFNNSHDEFAGYKLRRTRRG